MFADLHAELDALPPISVVAVGGIPIRKSPEGYQLFGASMDVARLRTALREGLGLGAVLTYRNRSELSLEDLAQICIEREHLWTAHVLMLTVAFDRCPIRVRNALAFDRRFHLSWVEAEVEQSPCTFTATGSLREWSRVMAYAKDGSFHSEQRQWFEKTAVVLGPLFPTSADAER